MIRRMIQTAVVTCLAMPGLAACDGPEYDAFDFWLGEWTIEQKFYAGEDVWIELPAKTTVTKVLDGCALLERWEGEVQYPWLKMTEPQPLEGLSIRYYLPDEKMWRIQWMDTMKPFLADGHYGTIEDGHGEFVPRPRPEGGRWSKIIFERKTEEHVQWRLDFTADDGESFQTIWIMEMRRASEERRETRGPQEVSDLR